MEVVSTVLRRWKRWLVAAVVVAAAVAVVGPFLYIHVIEGTPPARLSLASGTSATPTAAPGDRGTSASLDGTWKVTSGSQAGYRVKEILFGQDSTAVGRTSQLSGSITISGTTVQSGTVTIDLTAVTSDESRRDDQFQGRIMDTSRYPTATFTLTEPIHLTSIPAVGARISTQATGQLTLHGTTKLVTVQLAAQHTASGVQVSGTIPVTFADWGIPNPSFGPVSTDDHGVIEFLLDLSRS